jgi:hypothetical protein
MSETFSTKSSADKEFKNKNDDSTITYDVLDEENDSNDDNILSKRKHNKIFKKCGSSPPDNKAAKYLLNANVKYKDFIMNLPPIRAKAGQVFLYKPETAMKTVSIADQYNWISSDYRTQKNNPSIKRHRYYSRNAGGVYNAKFQRYVYYCMNQDIEDRIYLIVYVGDEKTFIDAPHGNRKHDKERNFIKTNKALLNSLKGSDAFPHTLYKQKISEQNSKLQSIEENLSLAYESSEIPRDVKQIENKLYNERKKNKISRDYIYNLYEIGVNLDPFVLELKLLPELQIIFGKNF